MKLHIVQMAIEASDDISPESLQEHLSEAVKNWKSGYERHDPLSNIKMLGMNSMLFETSSKED